MAEPLSGLRLDASSAGRSLAAGQWLAGDAAWLAAHRPEVVLQVGASPTTRATQALLGSAEAVVVLDRDHLDPDPDGRAERRMRVDPELFAAVAWDEAEAGHRPPPADPAWAEAWRGADLLARAAVDRTIDAWSEPFEGRVARDLAGFVPHGSVFCVGSSTPVRDLDAYMAPRRPPRIWNPTDLVRFVANRGASGIDGFVSTTLGAAATDVGPTYALLGDLTFLLRRRRAAVVGTPWRAGRARRAPQRGRGDLLAPWAARAPRASRAVRDAARHRHRRRVRRGGRRPRTRRACSGVPPGGRARGTGGRRSRGRGGRRSRAEPRAPRRGDRTAVDDALRAR